jgi:O-antigen/teichoic acid export membrane protein
MGGACTFSTLTGQRKSIGFSSVSHTKIACCIDDKFESTHCHRLKGKYAFGGFISRQCRKSPEGGERVSEGRGVTLVNLGKNILTTLGARTMVLALALISSIVLARMLGPEGRGLFALVLLLPDLARSFGLFGFEQANTVYAGLEPENRRALVGQSTIIGTLLGGGIAVACIAFLAFGAPGSQTLVHGPLWLYVLPLAVIPCALVCEYWGAVIRGTNRIALSNALEVGSKAASLVLVVVFVGWLGLDVAGAVSADIIVNVAGLLLMALVLKYVDLWGRPSFDWSLWKRTARFALPAHCSTVMTYLNYRVDQFIIAVFLPPEQLAYYVISVGLAERLWMLTGAVAGPLLPHLTNSPNRDPAVAAIISRHVMVWTGAACFIVFVFADFAVQLLYSAEFSPSVAPLRWLLPGIITLSVGKVLVAELLARKKSIYTLWISVVTALLNVVGNVLLIPSMGISGAALASTVSYTLSSALLVWCYLRETGVPWNTLLPRLSDVQLYLSLGRRAAHLVLARTAAVTKVQL